MESPPTVVQVGGTDAAMAVFMCAPPNHPVFRWLSINKLCHYSGATRLREGQDTAVHELCTGWARVHQSGIVAVVEYTAE